MADGACLRDGSVSPKSGSGPAPALGVSPFRSAPWLPPPENGSHDGPALQVVKKATQGMGTAHSERSVNADPVVLR